MCVLYRNALPQVSSCPVAPEPKMVAAPDIDWMASSFPPACCTLLYVFALQSCLPPSLHFCFEMVFLLPFMFFLSRCKWSGVLACILSSVRVLFFPRRCDFLSIGSWFRSSSCVFVTRGGGGSRYRRGVFCPRRRFFFNDKRRQGRCTKNVMCTWYICCFRFRRGRFRE